MPYLIMQTPFCDLLINDEYCYADIAANSDLPADIKNNCPLAPVNTLSITFNLRFVSIIY